MRDLLVVSPLLAALVLSSSAQAQPAELPDGVLLILNAANTADESNQQLTLVEVGNVLRDREIDFTVIGEHECTFTSDGCLDLRSEHDADAVVIISVYSGDPGRVDLQLFDADRSGEGSQSWIGDPSTAAGQAMQGALETFAPESIRVVIAGTPEGATVWLGRRTGHLPFIGTVSPGEHRLRVTAEGYRTLTETLEIPATSEEWTHEVTLEEGEDPEETTSPGETPDPAPGNGRGVRIGLGVAALVVGVGLGIGGAALLTKDGDCELAGCVAAPDRPGVVPIRETTAQGVALLAVGVALVAAGTGLTIAGLEVDAAASPSGAQLSIRGTF